MDDLKKPAAMICYSLIFIIAIVFTTIGVIGSIQSLTPLWLYASLLVTGVVFTLISAATLVYTLIVCCFGKPKVPVRRRQNPVLMAV